MRPLTLAISAVLVTAVVASFVLLFASPEAHTQTRAAEAQYTTGDTAVPDTTSQERLEATSSDGNFMSQGSLEGQTVSDVLLRAAAEDMAEEERLPDYSQVVDNDTKGRFKAPGWQEHSGGGSYRGEYAYAEGETEAQTARFKVDIPTAGDYAVYAWWPAARENSDSARFGVSTAYGTKWTQVNQQRDGGFWVKLGTFEMEAGDSYAVRVFPEGGSGVVVADAVAVVRGAASPPPDEEQASDGDQLYAASGGRPNGRDVVRLARKHIGTPYRASPPNPCRAYRSEDCSCHTKVVFRRFDRHLRDNPVEQWKRGKRIARSNLRFGDLVFFDEDRDGRLEPWDHVGIFSGNGNLVHASSYHEYRRVVESKMKYIRGYWGAKRIKPR